MTLTADIAPPNSVLIMDRSVGQIPDSLMGGLTAFTPTCVAIGTRSEHDGDTRVTLEENDGSSCRGVPAFDGVLDTPDRKIAVCSVLDDVIFELPVPAERTRVRIWANDASEPSEIYIVVSSHVS